MKRIKPCQHYRTIRTKKGKKKIMVNKGVLRKRRLFHGTSEEALAQMALTGGLSPRGGKLYLTDDPNYARFKGRQAVKDTRFKPIVIELNEPEDIAREGRHFFTKKTIPVREFRSVDVKNGG